MRDFWKPMPVSGKLIRELLLLFLLFGVQQSYAQRITRQYNNVSFSAALKDLNARQHKYTITEHIPESAHSVDLTVLAFF